MVNNDFGVLILTHGRPNKVVTERTLRKQGYSGKIYIVCDNEDETLPQYRARFGDNVIVFDKKSVAQQMDEGDNGQDRRSVVYARNAAFAIAREAGLKYFVQLDDDYDMFLYKFDVNGAFKECTICNLDRLFGSMLEYYKSIPALTIAMAQNGDFQGGALGHGPGVKRKAMNTFFCSVERPFGFLARINEDVTTYCTLGNRGELFLTIMDISIHQQRTQQSAGGMTELYRDFGTYIKSFYPVMYCPSFVSVGLTGTRHLRLHHHVRWDNAVPKIIEEKYRKK